MKKAFPFIVLAACLAFACSAVRPDRPRDCPYENAPADCPADCPRCQAAGAPACERDLDQCRRDLAAALGPRGEIYRVKSIAELGGDAAALFTGLDEQQRATALDLMNSVRAPDQRGLGVAHCLADAGRLKCDGAQETAQKIVELVRRGVDPSRIARQIFRKEVEAGASPSLGPALAPVTIVIFSDFQCPYCKRGAETMREIVADYPAEVRLVFKNLPLNFHARAKPAALAALAAQRQQKFWEMHDLLFENNRALADSDLRGYAEKIGLDLRQFAADLGGESALELLEADLAQARSPGVRSTPMFFVNGLEVKGAKPLAEFKKIIDEELGAGE